LTKMALTLAKHYKSYESELIDSYYELSTAAENAREVEYMAATVIQRDWRRYVSRAWWTAINQKTEIIQKSFRGHMGRRNAQRIAIEQRRKKREDYFSGMATKIQKV
jgi:IQ calmodulin-binding motif